MNIRESIKSRDLYMVAVRCQYANAQVYGYGLTPQEAMRSAIRAIESLAIPGWSRERILEDYGDQLSSALVFRVGAGIVENRGGMV